MGYRVRVTKKNGLMDKRQYLCLRDINNDGGGYTRATIRHATIFETKEEINTKEFQAFLELGYDYSIEEV